MENFEKLHACELNDSCTSYLSCIEEEEKSILINHCILMTLRKFSSCQFLILKENCQYNMRYVSV
jgi:hypothetical protein